jgi:hypothetical protein
MADYLLLIAAPFDSALVPYNLQHAIQQILFVVVVVVVVVVNASAGLKSSKL